MQFHIETENLILREFRLTDAEDFFKMDSLPEVHRYLGNTPVQSIDQVIHTIEFIQSQYASFRIGRWAAIEKSSGNFIGWSGLKYVTELTNNRTGFYDVGYRLHPNYWGKGYATQSAMAVLTYGFKNLPLDEVIGTCNIHNKASRRVLEKCGLKFVENFMWKTIPCDWLSISKSDWLYKKQE